ncbi:fibronectin type III domain-containing protein [Microlunatus antarcticus]|uniref:Outer membrane protein OmpA-like peptidoglycan-associated protein n=1 Tax=Microlunatus antarcticus TaxID=53388 RepID=A0A7W5P7N1_9ACTN|nr:fibronectin type III domain-containing protein [Microlunatus antarcticus]MBB3327739.1 outer membrane protein OmpA-like peptidoglycan-associated protein [Microlunatus antarcticus]
MSSGPRVGYVRRACTVIVALVLGALSVLVAGPVALAGAGLVTTAPTTALVPPDATTGLTGASVGGAADDASLQVTVSTDRGTLSVATTTGLDLAFGNAWAGTSSITFSGVTEDLNSALATLAITTGSDAGVTADVTVAALLDTPGFVYSPTNQHFYEYVPAPAIDADTARAEAQQRTFLGQHGYLATMASAAVNDLVSTRIEGARSVWFGARSVDDYPTRTWVWGDGPLAGQVISSCVNFFEVCQDVADPGVYRSWAPGEPNNAGAWYDNYSGEWAAVTNWGGIGSWNDLPPSNDGTSGYVVEYGDQAVGATTFNGIATSTATIDVRGVPGAPTGVLATRGAASASVSFDAPASDGGSVVTGYTVTTAPGGTVTSCATSPCEVDGLTNGTAYTFTVRAMNALGTGEPSAASDAVTPAVAPGAPTDIRAVATDASATVSFTAPAADGGSPVTGYVVQVGSSGDEVSCAVSPCLVTGLENGTTYALTVRAVNDAGRSVASEPAEVTPAGLADAPRSVTARRGDQKVTLTFARPAQDGGAAVTGYLVETTPGGDVTSCTTSPCTVEGLTNGTSYTFEVRARTSAGLGEASEPTSPVVPATVPGAPTGLTAERGDGSAVLGFDAPGSDGGSDVTAYEVSVDGGDTWTALEVDGHGSLTATVDGLTNGVTYVFEVRARNDVGPGEAAGEPSVTPARRPGTPTGVSAVRGDEEVRVSFTAPASNGSPITGYVVGVEPGGHEVPCEASPCTVPGLENGTSYTFTVRATNDVGESSPSDASEAVTPAGKPSAPELLGVTSGDASLALVFDAPETDGGSDVLGYEATVDGGHTWVALDSVATGDHLTGVVHSALGNGRRYVVSVRAVNAVGAGTPSGGLAATPATVPGAVRDLAVAVSDGKVSVSWSRPASDGGSALVGYRVVVQPGGRTCETTSTSCTITGLPTGVAYTFTVTASNTDPEKSGTGRGAATTSDAVTVTGPPSVPQALQVTPGDRRLDLSFRTPAVDGGLPVTGYELSLDGGQTWSTARPTGTDPLALAVVPVLNGRHYDVAVRARNAQGAGIATTTGATTLQWFADPVSPAAAAAEVAVPKKPQSYHGRLRTTRATLRSADGTVAMPATALKGRQLQPGQATDLNRLFHSGDARFTTKGRAQVKEVARSLTYVRAVTCEGYTDYRGRTAHLKSLSAQRADAVCDALRRDLPQELSLKKKAYGLTRPVLVGGKSTSRWTNRRVVVVVRD